MPVQLPPLPALATIKPRLNSFRAILTPALGGPVQQVNRVGSRYSIDVQVPSMEAACARVWLAARLKAEATNDVLRLTWPEAEDPLNWQGVVVNGGGQAGTQFAVRGLPANADVPAGRFFSILHEDGYRLYATTDEIVADASGSAILSISPMLRKSPDDGFSIHFDPVTMDALADGTTVDWELQLKRWTTFSFTLSEFQ